MLLPCAIWCCLSLLALRQDRTVLFPQRVAETENTSLCPFCLALSFERLTPHASRLETHDSRPVLPCAVCCCLAILVVPPAPPVLSCAVWCTTHDSRITTHDLCFLALSVLSVALCCCLAPSVAAVSCQCCLAWHRCAGPCPASRKSWRRVPNNPFGTLGSDNLVENVDAVPPLQVALRNPDVRHLGRK
jgi:hypothetical protein